MQNTEQTQQYTRHSLAKIDKSQYTKEQWKAIKEQRRIEKSLSKLAKLNQKQESSEESYSDNPLIKDKNYIFTFYFYVIFSVQKLGISFCSGK